VSGKLDWKPITPGEKVLRYADFTDELATGESLTSVAVSTTVWSGNDPAAQGGDADLPSLNISITIMNNYAGVAAVAAAQVTGGILGTIYQVVLTGTTNNGHLITKTAALAIKPPLN
jgi:hypothetical protein